MTMPGGMTLERLIDVVQEWLAQAQTAQTQGIELKPFVRSLKEAASS
jgi:hypothetical protein